MQRFNFHYTYLWKFIKLSALLKSPIAIAWLFPDIFPFSANGSFAVDSMSIIDIGISFSLKISFKSIPILSRNNIPLENLIKTTKPHKILDNFSNILRG